MSKLRSSLHHFFREKLAVEMSVALIFSLLIAYFLYQGLYAFTNSYIEKKVYSTEYIEKKDSILYDSLVDYIEKKEITLSDISKLNDWANRAQALLSVYYNNELIFECGYMNTATEIDDSVDDTTEITEDTTDSSYDISSDFDNETLNALITIIAPYQFTLADGEVISVGMDYNGYYRLYTYAQFGCLLCSFLVFLIIFLCCIRKKISYLQKLAQELKHLESGNLDYCIAEQGCDELYALANGINQMRESILEKQNRENYNRAVNQRLVTSLSHDIRTPLTSLIGYIELLELHRYKDEAQLAHFLGASKQKAYQIRDMANQLFEYFVVSEKTENSYNKELIATKDLANGLLENQLFDLDLVGYKVVQDFDSADFSHHCMLDVEFIQRIMDNIQSNLKKYASMDEDITVNAKETENTFEISFTNSIKKVSTASSTGIGIQTCKKIAFEHGGSFVSYPKENQFYTLLVLPFYKPV